MTPRSICVMTDLVAPTRLPSWRWVRPRATRAALNRRPRVRVFDVVHDDAPMSGVQECRCKRRARCTLMRPLPLRTPCGRGLNGDAIIGTAFLRGTRGCDAVRLSNWLARMGGRDGTRRT